MGVRQLLTESNVVKRELQANAFSVHYIYSFTHSYINSPINQTTTSSTYWSRIILDKIVVSEVINKFLVLCGSKWFVPVFPNTIELRLSGRSLSG